MRTVISKEGQPYVDEPVYVKPIPVSVIERSLARAFGHSLQEAILVRYERVKLRWMKPGPDGKLVPR